VPGENKERKKKKKKKKKKRKRKSSKIKRIITKVRRKGKLKLIQI
jgi:hypothetical protein